MARSPYEVLGVGRTADDAEVQKAYRRLAKELHPDKNPGNGAAEERFKEVSAAYDILGDKAKRARFDRGEIDADGRERAFAAGGPRPGGGGARAGARHFDFRTGGPGGIGPGGINIEEILGGFFGGRGGAAGGLPGEDVRLLIEVDLQDAARGAVKRVSLPDGESVDLTVPAGIESGRTLRLRGKGRPGPAGGPSGDVLVEVRVREDPRFEREGLDLTAEATVPLRVAVLGGKVRVPTLDGEVSLSVPPGSSSGRLLRLRGKGVREAGTGGRTGDQLVRLLVEVPADDPGLEAWARGRAEA